VCIYQYLIVRVSDCRSSLRKRKRREPKEETRTTTAPAFCACRASFCPWARRPRALYFCLCVISITQTRPSKEEKKKRNKKEMQFERVLVWFCVELSSSFCLLPLRFVSSNFPGGGVGEKVGAKEERRMFPQTLAAPLPSLSSPSLLLLTLPRLPFSSCFSIACSLSPHVSQISWRVAGSRY